MVFDNRKLRYNYFITNGDTVRAAELANRYPDVVEEVKEVVEEKTTKKEEIIFR